MLAPLPLPDELALCRICSFYMYWPQTALFVAVGVVWLPLVHLHAPENDGLPTLNNS